MMEQVEQTVIDYTPMLTDIQSKLDTVNQTLAVVSDIQQVVGGAVLFGTVVVICHYGYKFLKLFF